MADIVKRQPNGIEEAVNTGNYEDFQGLSFEIIELSSRDVKLRTTSPTYIRQSSGPLELEARAPTIVEGSSGELYLDAYAAILIRGGAGNIYGKLRENTAIEGGSGDLTLIVAPHLNGMVQPGSGNVNDDHDNSRTVIHFNAPDEAKGIVLLKGCSGNINFSYDSQLKLYKPSS